MRYRIVKKELCGKLWFEIQSKFLFWWFTETAYDIGWYGECSSYTLTFDTKTEAQDYICQQQRPKTIWYD